MTKPQAARAGDAAAAERVVGLVGRSDDGSMGGMVDDPEVPSAYLGDHPDGAYWSAVPAESTDETAPTHAVSGDVVRFMWDYGVSVPLWDREGLLPDDPGWLREVLGLSEDLIQALSDWGRDMNTADGTPWSRRPQGEWEQTYQALDARARDLVEWLRRELTPTYEVTYQPW